MKRFCLISLLSSMFLVSCDNLFWDDDLDYQWRLDTVEYTAGCDFQGNVAGTVQKSQCWLSMARDLAIFEDLSDSCGAIRLLGSFERYSDSIRFDYSVYTDRQHIESELSRFGLSGVVSSFEITSVDRRNMVLSGDSTTLYFTRW